MQFSAALAPWSSCESLCDCWTVALLMYCLLSTLVFPSSMPQYRGHHSPSPHHDLCDSIRQEKMARICRRHNDLQEIHRQMRRTLIT